VQQCPLCSHYLLPLFEPGSDTLIRWVAADYGRYRLVAPARPGDTRLFRAEERPGGRKVAIRIFPEYQSLDAVTRERLDREIGILQGTSHPNLCRLLDHGMEGCVRWYAREWAEGDALAVVLEDLRSANRTMPFGYALPWFQQLCGALQALHDRGLAHGRVRPGRIILGSDQKLKLSEPELLQARSIGGGITSEPVAGKRDPYLAPERYSDPARRDARSDIFETGVVMHELLAGFLPGAVVRRVSLVNPSVPENFAAVLMAMLQTDPANRPAAIGPLAEGKRPPSPAGGAPNIDKLANTLGGALLGGLIGGAIGVFMAGRPWYGALAGVVAGTLSGALFGTAAKLPTPRLAPPPETADLAPAPGRTWAPPQIGSTDPQDRITRKDN
jgi:hypothetical protein